MAGIPLAAICSSLSYFDSYRRGWLPANLIQAQRDYFGAHTYERTDRKEFFIHIGIKTRLIWNQKIKLAPQSLCIFGATGDLTWRKLIPAIYNLYLDKWIPEKFAMIGVGRSDQNDNQFREHLHEGVDKFSRRGKSKKKEWDDFAPYIEYHKGEFTESSTYSSIEKQIKQIEKKWKATANRIFYMAVPPDVF